jgi:fructosamine-3-kinase
MRPEVAAAVEHCLGRGIRGVVPVSGGDINEAYAVTLGDASRVFVKTHAHADPGMFPVEARGLEWLAQAGALRVPEVLGVSSGDPAEPAFLILEYLEPGRQAAGFDEALGRGLAALHRRSPGQYGLDHDNFIGRLPQDNRPLPAWVDFYRERRLGAQLALAERQGRASERMRRGFDRLFVRLADRMGPEEPPARLHGDLWGGNLHVTPEGDPCLIDPAVYGGHREVDLAMMRLFGGFSARCFAAYEEAYPLAPGAEERVALYQLYPLMVHVNLFGGSYAASVERALERLA